LNYFSLLDFSFAFLATFQTMPKWLRTLIFNTVRAYSCVRRAFYRIMDQLAAMLARAAVPGGTATGGLSATDGVAASAPQVSGESADIPDREVCEIYFLL
jgi:hypothetical protein